MIGTFLFTNNMTVFFPFFFCQELKWEMPQKFTFPRWTKSHLLWFYWAGTLYIAAIWFLLWQQKSRLARKVSLQCSDNILFFKAWVTLCAVFSLFSFSVQTSWLQHDGNYGSGLAPPIPAILLSCVPTCSQRPRVRADTVCTVLIGTAAARAGVRALALFCTGWQTT